MLGSSRESMAALSDALDLRRSAPDFPSVASELLALADLLSREKSLRVALADSGQSEQAREALATSLFSQRVGLTTNAVFVDVVRARWSHAADIVEALERLGAQAAFTVADADGSLDRVEEEIFRFGRAADASAELQMTITDPSLPPATKSAVVRDVLGGRTAPATSILLEYFAGHLGGRRVDDAVGMLSELAAAQRERVVAEVRAAIDLDFDQRRRLAESLSRLQGRQVRLNIAIDPEVLGGISVRIGGEVIDGTVASRLEQARRALLS